MSTVSQVARRKSERQRAPRQGPELPAIQREKWVKLGRQRAGYASHVTSCYRKFCHAVEDPRTPMGELITFLQNLEDAFDRFKTTHDQYVDLTATVEPFRVDYCATHYHEMSQLLYEARTKMNVANFKRQQDPWENENAPNRFQDKRPDKDQEREEGEISPDDSISQYESRVSRVSLSSRTSSALAKAAAKRAALTAKLRFQDEMAEKEMEIKRQTMEMDMQKQRKAIEMEKMKIKAELEMAKIEEETLAEYLEERSQRGSVTALSRHSRTLKFYETTPKRPVTPKPTEGKGPSQDFVTSTAARSEGLNPLAPEWMSPIRHQSSVKSRCEAFVTEHDFVQQKSLENQPTASDVTYRIGPDPPEKANVRPMENQVARAAYRVSGPQASGFQDTAAPPIIPTSYQVNQPVFNDYQMLSQRQLFDAMRLPKPKIMDFSGDCLKYHAFMNSFDSSIHHSTVTDADKLNCLLEYCTGDAAEAIEHCPLMENSSEGYAEARKCLKKLFGDPHAISQAWIKKVTEGPDIKPNNGKALRKFANEVKSCLETLKAMRKLNEIDSQDRMAMVTYRLPVYLRTRWQKKVIDIKEAKKRYPNFEELSQYLDRIAEEACDPVFGRIGVQKPKGKAEEKTLKKGKTASNFSVQAKEATNTSSSRPHSKDTSQTEDIRCPVCNKEHRISSCPDFKSMDAEKRLDIAKERRLCYNCLIPGHGVSKCRKSSYCEKDCRKHSKFLHAALVKKTENQASEMTKQDVSKSSRPAKEKKEQKSTDSANGEEAKTGLACIPAQESKTIVALPIVTVYVRGKDQDKFIRTRALLDTGSNRTFCSEDLARELQIKGNKTKLSLETLGEDHETSVTELQLEATAKPSGKRKLIQLPRVYALKTFPKLTQNLNLTPTDIARWRHLQDLKLIDHNEDNIGLLIGQDVPAVLRPLEIRRGGDDEPYATRSVFGWCLNGPLSSSAEEFASSNFVRVGRDSPDALLQAQVEQFWKIDGGPSVLAKSKPEHSREDLRALEIWEQSCRLEDGHYYLDIPFRENKPRLPNNRLMAEKRLRSLGKRLSKDQETHEKYKAGIQDLLDKGYAEIAPEDKAKDGMEFYLSHFNVKSQAKPSKFRIVFHASEMFGSTSLNKEVLQGPDLTNSLVGVLLRFRERPVATMGDVEAMFHQVRVTPKHRDVLRFLFWKDGVIGGEIQVYRMTVHLFGGIWSPSCASYALRRTADDNSADFAPEIVTTVKRDTYVDDNVSSHDLTEDAIKTVQGVTELVARGGFHMRGWCSNDKTVLKNLPVEERAKTMKTLDLDKDALPVERALGTHWDTETDMIGISIRQKEPVFTKRGLLSITSSIFDPLGICSAFVLRAKILFQDECKRHLGWDEDMTPENTKKFQKWLDDIPRLKDFKIPRCIQPKNFGTIVEARLHHFSDASSAAYGACSFLRIFDGKKTHCALVLAKSRLAPISTMTIPRLELSAAVTAVQLDAQLRREMTLPLQPSVFWTDSTIVLHYIRNTTKRFQTFVANRIAMIHDGSTPDQWRYVPTKQNPADLASRGLSAEGIINDTKWTLGPDFLKKSEEEWPENPIDSSSDQLDDDPEVRKDVTSCTSQVKEDNPTERLLSHYSNWYRVRKAVAWYRRFFHWLKNDKSTMNSSITVDELQSAETAIIRHVQDVTYKTEYQDLSAGRHVGKKSPIHPLEPFLDQDGILKVTGRLSRARISESSKHPTIVPRDHHVTELIVRHIHERRSHSGREHIMAAIREKYWIPSARPLVKKVLQRCVLCKRLKGTLQGQRMADLPAFRVNPSDAPFAYTGVDVFGPFYVKKGRGRGKYPEKRYGCLFTCLTMRAIHLEKLNSLEADSFLNALIRFIARKNQPRKIRSDNGTNLVRGNKELRDTIREWNENHKTKEELLIREIEWEFNPPAASHMGGVWERQIRTVRNALNTTLRNQVLDDERLETLFAEVENVINSRPLTHVSEDPSDLKALTPNDLLRPGHGFTGPPGEFSRLDAYGKRWRHVQHLVNEFWRRWLREYLPTLMTRSKWITDKRNIRVGDIVIILDESQHRMYWPLGRVKQVFPDKDGVVRFVELKTANMDSMKRPIHKIILLEGAED